MRIRTTHNLQTTSWKADVEAVETEIGQFELDRAVANDCAIALFEIDRDDCLHVNVTHMHPTKTVRGWTGPAHLDHGFVHNRTFDRDERHKIAGQIKRMVFAERA
jgi:hypothetical protein